MKKLLLLTMVLAIHLVAAYPALAKDPQLQVPLLADGKMYFVGPQGLLAVELETGKQVWKLDYQDLSAKYPNSRYYFDVAERAVCFSGVDAVTRVDLETKKEQWTLVRKVEAFGPPLIANGAVFVGSMMLNDGRYKVGENHDAYLYAVDLKTGQEKWRVATKGDASAARPYVSGGTVYFFNYRPVGAAGPSDAVIHAVDIATGKETEKFTTTHSSAKADFMEGMVIPDRGDAVVDVRTGRARWTFERTGKGEHAHAGVIKDGVLYGLTRRPIHRNNALIGEEGDARAVNLATGREIWNAKATTIEEALELSPPAVGDKALCVLSWNAKSGRCENLVLRAFDSKTGVEQWTYQPAKGRTRPLTDPVIAKGRVYLVLEDGSFQGVDLQKGKLALDVKVFESKTR